MADPPARPERSLGLGANDVCGGDETSGTMPLNGKQLWCAPHRERQVTEP